MDVFWTFSNNIFLIVNISETFSDKCFFDKIFSFCGNYNVDFFIIGKNVQKNYIFLNKIGIFLCELLDKII